MKLREGIVAAAVAMASLTAAQSTQAAIIFDDFEANEGHFNLAPTFSGSTTNMATTSTADRFTTGGVEGIGFESLTLNATTAGTASRVRFLSGSGTPANNTNFA